MFRNANSDFNNCFCRILGVINEKAVVTNNALAIRPTCTLTLSPDHRIVNGRESAEFLQQLKYNLEELKF